MRGKTIIPRAPIRLYGICCFRYFEWTLDMYFNTKVISDMQAKNAYLSRWKVKGFFFLHNLHRLLLKCISIESAKHEMHVCGGKNVHFLFQFERTIWRCIIHTALLSMVDEINVFGFGNIVLNSLWFDYDEDICISFKVFAFKIIKTVHLRNNNQSISYFYSFIQQRFWMFTTHWSFHN